MPQASQTLPSRCTPSNAIQAVFLTLILPKVESHGQVAFRSMKCHDRREDAICEMVAIAWKWTLRLVERGKDVAQFPTAIATYAARAVKSGRRLTRQEKPNDVLSPLAQKRRGFAVASIPCFSMVSPNPLSEALADNTQTPPDEQAAFRIDFPAWLSSQDDRRRRIAEDLMMGERTLDVADKFGISGARISQMRREFMEDWSRFCGEEAGC